MSPSSGARGPQVLFVAVLLLVGCSDDTPASQAVFNVQGGGQPNAADQPCLLHQTHEPTAAYRGGPDGVTALELPFLASYTANGTKAFCDKKKPSTLDKKWARLYVELTGNSAAVAPILSG
jgi:hypothetical protein